MHGVWTIGGLQFAGRLAVVLAVFTRNVPPFETVTLSSKTTLPPENVTVTPLLMTKPLLPFVHLT